MKVIGLGSPYDVQIRFDASEVDVLVDVLRERRADATRDAASIYATTPSGETEAVDDRHNRLRAVEALLMQLEEQPRRTGPGRSLSARRGSCARWRARAPGKRCAGSVTRGIATTTTRPRSQATYS